jgi:hypothetical protein
MSLGPTDTAANALHNRLSQTQRTQLEQTERTERAQPAAAQALPSEQVEAQRVTASPEAQAESRAAARGSEDAIRARLQQTQEAPTSTDAPRRGLGGGSDLDGMQLVNKRSGKGRRTAMNDEGGIERPSTATASRGESANTPNAPSAIEDSFQLAGKRSGKGTRVGNNDTLPVPGTPRSDIA